MRTAARSWHHRRGQSGQSLIEVIIAILIMGGMFGVVATALITVVRAGTTNENIQLADAAVVSYGEILQTQVPYYPCSTPPSPWSTFREAYYFASDPFMTLSSNPATALWRRPSNVGVTVTAVKSYDAATGGWAGGCISPDPGVQLISYRVFVCKNPVPDQDLAKCDSPVFRDAEIVKRKQGPS